MRVNRTYAGGGLLSNSFEKFDDMAGASGPIGSSYAKNRFGFGTKGGALRREKRAIKRSLAGGMQGPAAEQYQDRLDYLKKVQGHRAKKGIAAGALAAGAFFGGPALAGALQNAGGLSGIAGKIGGLAGKFKGSGAIGNIQKGKQLFDALTPDQEAQIDTGNFGQPDQFLNYGGKIRVLKAEEGVKVPEGADVRSLLASLDRFSEEKKRRKKMEERQFAPSTPDKEMNREVLSFLLEKFKDSVPSIMGSKASDRYYNR